jgi:hypothetical protein
MRVTEEYRDLAQSLPTQESVIRIRSVEGLS